jgi:hypothetical protein
MRRKLVVPTLVLTVTWTEGCYKASKSPSQLVDRSMMNTQSHLSPYVARLRGGIIGGGGGGHASALAISEVSAYAAEVQRFVATKHTLEMIAKENELQKSWQAVVDYCGTISCEVLSSNITNKTEQDLPSGHIALRVQPDQLKKLLAFVESQGRVAAYSAESEDKTGQVVDTEARIKNLTTFRDNLRAMLSRPSVTVKDSIEIQGQLTEVQSQLDSETAGRKALANETEKVAVDITFRVEKPRHDREGFRQIWNALRDSGSILAESTAWLIMAVMTLLPWVVVVGPLAWFAVRWVRRWRNCSRAVRTEKARD